MNISRLAAIALSVVFALPCFGHQPEWSFYSAELSPDPANGTVVHKAKKVVLDTEIPSANSCGWWEGEFPVATGKGARFTATAEISLGKGVKEAYNDVMMFVTWYDPNKGNKKSGTFYQRDFMRYTDEVRPDGRIIRHFDDTFAVPKDCNMIRMDLIAKWHEMKIKFRDIKVEEVEAPASRIVRCVVGTPFEKFDFDWKDSKAVMDFRLGQIESCLEKIYAEVEHPDIILFSEAFVCSEAPRPREVTERIPGGPSFQLAAKWAKKMHCYIAMNVKEETEQGTVHNSTFICDRNGELAGIQRKTTLTSREYMSGLVPGNDFPVFELDFGRVGALTCWENWFSETAKFIKRNGAELILFPLAGGQPDHFETVFPARAIDTGVPFMVAVRHKTRPSGIIDRDGNWIAISTEDGGYAVADIDLNERKRSFWLSVGPGYGDPYEMYYDESRPELYEKQIYGPRK